MAVDGPEPPARKTMSVRNMPKSLIRRLHYQAIAENRPMYELVEQAIAEYLTKHPLPNTSSTE